MSLFCNFRSRQAPPQFIFIVPYLRTPEQQRIPYYQHLISHPFEVPSILRVVASFHHYSRCTSPLTCHAVVSRRSLIVSSLPRGSVTPAARCFMLSTPCDYTRTNILYVKAFMSFRLVVWCFNMSKSSCVHLTHRKGSTKSLYKKMFLTQ